ncbi:hypothetical protein Zmor_001999 [Zophobas morio]|uniref:Nardilysin n=1 Tax=Zophobas morio TaxID=2755281 RepID=A0AA38MT69_9CUCU|nr:hypothetical protein Zmor_001999 [Zophobas morio]
MNKTSVENKTGKESARLKAKKASKERLTESHKNNVKFEVLSTPVKSDSDKKEYKVIRLENGLTACLISDPRPIEDDENDEELTSDESDEGSEEGSDPEDGDEDDNDDEDSVQEQKMAAASLCIGVGSFSDPKNIPGMAHFLEHMVFMGSEKFPKENDFDAFISKRGGSDNASTDAEVTTFYFQCLERDLATALDKFAQFFISPLMLRGSITREREAIDSEFQMALPSDSYRKEQLLASFAQSDSPVNSFGWGNLATLRDNVSEDDLYSGVHTFRKRHYSAHRMTLAIQARLPMNVLESYVLDCFNSVPSNDQPPDDFSQFKNVFDTPEFKKLYYIQPVHDLMQLELTWALPPLLDKYKSKPQEYVSFLLGDEGNGSLLSYLKKKVWVLSISAGNGESGSEYNSLYALFSINMTLTKEGLEHLSEVIESVFSYINMVTTIGPQERLYEEMKIVADTSFKFAAEETAVEIVEELSEAMQIYPPENYLTGSDLFFEYDPEAIKMVLNCLIPDKVNIIVLCNNLPPGLIFDKTEKWFGTKYTEQAIPDRWLKTWRKAAPRKEFDLPKPNVFLTEDFTILEEDEKHPEYPEKVLGTEVVELWHRKDQKFKLPIAYYNFYFINPKTIETPKLAALTDLYMSLMQISLAEEGYPAQVAHLSYSFRTHDKGIVIGVSGYNQKLYVLIELIANHLLTFKKNLTQEMFNAMKDKLIKYYYNRLLKPSGLAKELRLTILIANYQSLMDKFMVASTITFEDIQTFADEFIKTLYIKALVQGNVSRNYAINIISSLVATLQCQPINPLEYPNFRVSQIPRGESFCAIESFNKNDSNSVVTNYYQCGSYQIKDSVIIDLLMLILEEPLFDTLRTKEQLGYDVQCSTRDTFGIIGFTITVHAQATKNTTAFVEQRMETFVEQAANILTSMSKESFEDIKKDFIKTKRCVDVHLKEEVNRNWTEITDEEYIFDRIKKEIEEVQKITLEDVQRWWQAHTVPGNLNCRKLSVQVAGFKTSNDPATEENKDTAQNSKGSKLQLNFIHSTSNRMESEKEERCFVDDLTEFKKTLFLYPVASKFNIKA